MSCVIMTGLGVMCSRYHDVRSSFVNEEICQCRTMFPSKLQQYTHVPSRHQHQPLHHYLETNKQVCNILLTC